MKNVNTINIDSENALERLIKQIQDGPIFAEPFRFKTEYLSNKLFTDLHIPIDDFKEKYFYYNEDKHLHISESSEGFFWISTMGLVAPRGRINSIDNQYVRACRSQYIVINLLVEKAIDLCQKHDIYDIDGFYFDYLIYLNVAIEHNILFYLEIFAKAYLSINNIKFPLNHKLDQLYKKVKKTMFDLNQNDTSFHASIIHEFEPIIKHYSRFSKDFHESYVKYDDNVENNTVISFDYEGLKDIRDTLAFCNEFINEYYFNINDLTNSLYLEQGLYEKIMSKAKNKNQETRKASAYSFLLDTE